MSRKKYWEVEAFCPVCKSSDWVCSFEEIDLDGEWSHFVECSECKRIATGWTYQEAVIFFNEMNEYDDERIRLRQSQIKDIRKEAAKIKELSEEVLELLGEPELDEMPYYLLNRLCISLGNIPFRIEGVIKQTQQFNAGCRVCRMRKQWYFEDGVICKCKDKKETGNGM